jgi:hypothetical protein
MASGCSGNAECHFHRIPANFLFNVDADIAKSQQNQHVADETSFADHYSPWKPVQIVCMVDCSCDSPGDERR